MTRLPLLTLPLLGAPACTGSTYDFSGVSPCPDLEVRSATSTHAGSAVNDLLAELSSGTSTGQTPEGTEVLVTASFTPTGEPEAVSLSEAPDHACAASYPKLEVSGTWSLEAEDLFSVSWSGPGTVGPAGDGLSAQAHTADIALPEPSELPPGEGELWGLVSVSIVAHENNNESTGVAEQTWVTAGGEGEAHVADVLSW